MCKRVLIIDGVWIGDSFHLTAYTLTTRDYTLQVTVTKTGVLSLLQYPLALTW
jgi:hypothetical protein